MGVRLLSELFARCLQMLQSNSISSSCILLPFCCGGRLEIHLELLQLRNRNGTFW